MSSPQSAGDGSQRKLRVVRPPGALRVVLWEHIIPVLQTLMRVGGWQLDIDGADSARVGEHGQLSFKISKTTPDFPFKCPSTAGSGRKISPGTVNGDPVDGGDDISIGDNDIVFIKASLTLTKSAGGYIIGMTDVTYEFYTDTSRPDDTTTEAYFPIAQYVNGVCAQYVYGILGHTVDDDGTKTNVPVYFWGQI